MAVSYAWGKFDKDTHAYHRLEYHCADVAACFLELLRDPVLRSRLLSSCGQRDMHPVVLSRLGYLVYLHDLGKVSAGFQFKVPRHPKLEDRPPSPCGHLEAVLCLLNNDDMLAATGLKALVEAWGEHGFEPLLFASFSHHGRPLTQDVHDAGVPEWWKPLGDYDPLEATREVVALGREWFSDAFRKEDDIPALPSKKPFAHFFCGLVTLADHIGSDRDFFRYEEDQDPNYWQRAQKLASRAVQARHFSRRTWALSPHKSLDASLFGYASLRPCQEVVAYAPLDAQLLILESETGSGKTEASLLRFARLFQEGLVDGLYFALPTRAAAKQLYKRVKTFAKSLFPSFTGIQPVLAVPGYFQSGDGRGSRDPLNRFGVLWDDDPDEEKKNARWVSEQSRTYLSAPIAVGTVDQVLLAGLKVKWAHLRGASLARSFLVIDEVHASSPYMSKIIHELLRDHLALGGHALVMSATLGASTRIPLSSPSSRTEDPSFDDACKYPYPVLTNVSVDGRGASCQAIAGDSSNKCVEMSLAPILESPYEIASRCIESAEAGAMVLVIRNTVSSAQALFREIVSSGYSPLLFQVNGSPALHHSRFAAEDRLLLDESVESLLGKKHSLRSDRGAIVIGTQTLEQSLDIDADYLITDLVPADVLLQRIGRLHRHVEATRTPLYATPRCLVLVPCDGMEAALTGGLKKFGLGSVYENLLSLESTRRWCESAPVWTVPDDCRLLVEAATERGHLRALADSLGDAWVTHWGKWIGGVWAEAGSARLNYLDRNGEFLQTKFSLDDDDYARTRLGAKSFFVRLQHPAVGPFGVAVSTFSLPAHLFRGEEVSRDDLDSGNLLDQMDGTYQLVIGDHSLTYSNLGVEKAL